MRGDATPRPEPARWLLVPTRQLAILTLVALLLSLACVMVAIEQPWLGLDLAAQPDQRDAAPRITQAGGPSPGFATGALLVRLLADGRSIAIRGDDLAAEPDLAFAPYAQFDAFMQRQDGIAELLRADQVQLELNGGRRLNVEPASHRPLRALAWQFWFQLFCGQSCFLVAAALWVFRKSEPAARFAMLAGVGSMIAASSAAIYSTRELALPATLFDALSALNHLGTCLCTAGFVCVMFFYPAPLLRRGRPGLVALPLCLAWWALERLRLGPVGMASTNVLIVAGYLLSLALGAWQWRRVRRDLLARSAFQWFLLSWFFGSGVLMFVVLVPALAGYDTGEFQAYGMGALLVTEVGIVLGVARYRLFDLDTWWLRSVMLVLGAFIVLGLDVLFTAVLSYGRSVSLTLSLLAAGWLYFPLRQWLSQRIFHRTRQLQMDDVPELLREVLVNAAVPANQLLPQTLRQLFDPLQVEPLPKDSAVDVRIAEDGLALHVPGIAGGSAWRLRFANGGQRLFNRRDITLATAVSAVLQRFADYQTAVERGVEKERARVAQDLHDDVGARLLTLLHRSDDEAGATIREVIDSLRHTVHSLGADPRSLADTLASLRAESEERVEAAGAELRWTLDAPLPSLLLDAAQQQDLLRVLREGLSNALRHSRPTRIAVEVSATSTVLRVQLDHDGAPTAPEQWRPGVGLRGMRTRVQRLGGQLELSGSEGRVRLILELPVPGLHPPSAGQTAATEAATIGR